jgi:hypothetical protein
MSGEYCPLVRSVDLIVEHQNVDIHIAPEHMDHMIAADGKTVTVTGGDPHAQIGTCDLQS